jgi:hypothetical protein
MGQGVFSLNLNLNLNLNLSMGLSCVAATVWQKRDYTG